MDATLVEDRYVRHGPDRWLDLATGEYLSQVPRTMARQQVASPDFLAAIDRILRAVDLGDEAGIQVARLVVPNVSVRMLLDAASTALRPLGYVLIDAGVDVPPAARRALLHRHLVLWAIERPRISPDVESGGPHSRLVQWIRELTGASPRAHVLLLLQGACVEWSGPMPGIVREAALCLSDLPALAGWRARVSGIARATGRFIRAGTLQRAEAALQSVVAEAAVRGVPVPARILSRRRELRFWQGRWWNLETSGRMTMHLFHSISALLQIVQEADDDVTALKQGCSWVREHLDADAAGIAAGDGSRFIVSDGLGPSDLHDADLQSSFVPGCGRTIACGARAFVTAPVRYAGATIGFAVIRGRSEASEALDAAASALASVCAPALRARLDQLSLAAAGETRLPEILGRSVAMTALREAVARTAATVFPVLIEGESGTGKELVARAVHRLSARRDRRFVALNCAALTDELAEAELFGYTRGAFTGAVAHRAGLFEESHNGTLFLDEVTELSPRAQAKLLRVLQEREIRRVGESMARPVDVRVVAATNTRLADAVAAGRFREDLLFRLAVVRLRVPPLCERIEDIPLLAQAFWRIAIADTGKKAMLAPDALAALCRHRWPGNVRELQNAIAALVVTAPTRGRVGARHVQQVLAGHDVATTAADALQATLDGARETCERRTISAALARHAGRCSGAARELGLSRQGLAKAMKRLGLSHQSP